MKDDRLISLNAAIDALKRAEALVRAFGYHVAIDAVEALPSVSFENHDEIKSYSKDTISRVAAIKAADSIIERDTSGNNDVVKAITAWKEYIKELPPAQPEQPEWVQAVERWYNKALCNPCIHKPFAWALYQVWKEYDNEG